MKIPSLLTLLALNCASPLQIPSSERLPASDLNPYNFYSNFLTLYQEALERGESFVEPHHLLCGIVELHRIPNDQLLLYALKQDVEINQDSDKVSIIQRKDNLARERLLACHQILTSNDLYAVIGFKNQEGAYYSIDEQTFQDGTVSYVESKRSNRIKLTERIVLAVNAAMGHPPEEGKAFYAARKLCKWN